MSSRRFPRGFVWGVATAAPQIEGAATEGGKGESVWDRFSLIPGKTRGETPAVACDHYHRYRHDIALMARLGVRHYRLSVAWPRVFPEGAGRVNAKGLDFYRRLVDALLARGITPWVTLFHWDLPQALEDCGGWRSRATVDAFAVYADTVVAALGDRVKRWFTLNEIVCFTRRAYGTGEMAPGLNEDAAVVNQAYHHALVCHGHAVRAVREYGGRGAQVGLVDNPTVPIPVSETPRHIAAARRLFVEENIRVLDPLFRGHYAPAYLRLAGRAAPRVERGDFALIGQPADFLGLNLYTGGFVRAGRGGRAERLPFPPGYPRAGCRWLAYTPQVLYWGPRFVHELYRPPALLITENGAGFEAVAHIVAPVPDASGEIVDLHRRDYVRNCLGELHRAIGAGVPVRGYFLWSLLDNFEWHDGYATRFGIVHTDYATQRRTPKLSAAWYADVMKANRLV